MTTLTAIEQQFGFTYPKLYHQLQHDGMLDWGTFGPEWITGQYPELRKNPPLLLFAHDFELMTTEDIESQLQEFADENYWIQIRSGLQFIPFAQNGAGDWYCFFTSQAEDHHVPIVLLQHDANRATFKAKNFQDFIFRSMLEAVTDTEYAVYELPDEENFREDLKNFIRTHQKYLPAAQVQVLEEIYAAQAEHKAIINESRLPFLLKKHINFEKLNQEFKYQNS